jgi:hypothetical protein
MRIDIYGGYKIQKIQKEHDKIERHDHSDVSQRTIRRSKREQ